MQEKLRAYGSVFFGTRYRRVPDLVRLLIRRPALAIGVSTFESMLLASGRVPARLKALGSIKTSTLVGCPF